MAANDVNTEAEDTEMIDQDGEKVVTMMEVLEEQQQFEEDANAVLGASDDKNCTYTKGYIKRQAIYACLTCCDEAKLDASKRAGVCLACSLTCHENHELIELYTKRNFRCDCGNTKFHSNPCQLSPDKTELNDDNKYNQNFSGLYCICNRPYPDPEATIDDEMIQCIVCEDWLHSSHLDATVPSAELYTEMICKACMTINDFLYDYSEFSIIAENENANIEINSLQDNVINGHTNEALKPKENESVPEHKNNDEIAQLTEKTLDNEKVEVDLKNDDNITNSDANLPVSDISTDNNSSPPKDTQLFGDTEEQKSETTVDQQTSSKTEDNVCNNKESITDSTDDSGGHSTLNQELNKRKLEHEESDEKTSKKLKADDSNGCIRPKGIKKKLNGATFWPSNFREILCTCNECVTMYKDLSVLFLIDPDDTMTAYETLGMDKTDGTPTSQYEQGLEAFSSIDRVQQINALTEFNKMRDRLLDFLKSFKDRKEVVKEEDIKAFFAGMKPKREPDGVYFCR